MSWCLHNPVLKGHGVLVSFTWRNRSLRHQVETDGLYFWCEGIGAFNDGVDDGPMHLFGVVKEEGVNFSAPDDHHLLGLSERKDLIKIHGFHVIIKSFSCHDDVSTLREWPSKAFPSFPAHDNSFAQGDSLEVLQVGGLRQGKSPSFPMAPCSSQAKIMDSIGDASDGHWGLDVRVVLVPNDFDIFVPKLVNVCDTRVEFEGW